MSLWLQIIAFIKVSLQLLLTWTAFSELKGKSVLVLKVKLAKSLEIG